MPRIAYYCAHQNATSKPGVNADARVSYRKVSKYCRKIECPYLLYAVVTKQRLAEGRV